MYPAQTSLIPAQIALVRFFENQGWQAIFSNYPYWYLGTTPIPYLTGPVLPIIASGLHKIFPGFSLFDIFWLIIATSWLMGAGGVYWLVRELGGPTSSRDARLRGALAGIFFAFGPIVPFLFRFSSGVYLIAFSFLPSILLFYYRLLKQDRLKDKLIFIALVDLAVLIDSLIIPAVVIGMVAILMAGFGWRDLESKIKRSLGLLMASLFLATLWYTPGYWLTILRSPSLGGRGLAGVIVWLGKILPVGLALVFGAISVKFFKRKDALRDFCFYWFFTYLFLTLLRFLSDPDFWLDWTSYGIEVQFGLAILGGLLISRLNIKKFYSFCFLPCIFTIYFLIFTIIFNRYVIGTFQKDVAKSVEYRIGKQLSEIVKPPSASLGQAGERVFLSGTTAFWLNAFFDISQVRGGVDQAAVHLTWRKAIWEIREGTNPLKALEWLKELRVDYLVVHTEDSKEYYHDFVYPEKFENLDGLKKVYDQEGDRIYQVERD